MVRETVPMTALLTVGLIGAYELEKQAGGYEVCLKYGFKPDQATLETAATSVFLHDPSSVFHLVGNVACLLVFGIIVERAIGSLRFLMLFLAAGVGGALLHGVIYAGSSTPLVGCSGAVFGLLALACVIRPSLLWAGAAMVGFEIWKAFSCSCDGPSFACHLGGFSVGAFVVVVMWLVGSEVLES